MRAKKIFRGLLFLKLLVVAATVCSTAFATSNLPPELQHYAQSQMKQVESEHHILFLVGANGFILYWVLLVASLFGLFFFQRLARILYCICVFGGPVLGLCWGIHMLPRWASLWSDWDGILTGIILYMMFTSPFREAFVRAQHEPVNQVAETDA